MPLYVLAVFCFEHVGFEQFLCEHFATSHQFFKVDIKNAKSCGERGVCRPKLHQSIDAWSRYSGVCDVVFIVSNDRLPISSVVGQEARRILVPLLTLNGSLPQGSPASPVLANLALVGVDELLAEMCRHNGWRFTRYADDITISGVDGTPPEGVVDSVERICRQHNYSLNPKKTNCIHMATKVRVLGLLVHGNELRLPKSLRNRVRSANYRFELLRANERELSVSSRDLGLLSYAGGLERFNLLQQDN